MLYLAFFLVLVVAGASELSGFISCKVIILWLRILDLVPCCYSSCVSIDTAAIENTF